MMMRICSSKRARASGVKDVKWASSALFAAPSASVPSAGVMNSDAKRLATTSRLNSEIAVAMRPVMMPA